jgi:predicted MFS family arabinose efflux permease
MFKMSKSEFNRRSIPVLVSAFTGVCFNVLLMANIALSVLMNPISKELGWGRGRIGAMATLGQLGVAISAPLAAGLLNRYDARRVQLVIIALSGPLISSLGVVGDSLVGCCIVYALMGLITPGAGPIGTVLVGWFTGRRALALGVLGVASSTAQVALPWATNLFSGNFGWRGTYKALGLGTACVALPLQTLFFHERKRITRPHYAANPVAHDPPDFRFTECLCSRNFWILLGAYGAGMFAFVAFLPHTVAMVIDRGFSRSQAVTTLSVIAVGSFCGHIATGLSLDAVRTPRVLIPIVSVSTMGLVIIHHVGSSSWIYPAGFMIGIGAGGERCAVLLSPTSTAGSRR